MSQTDNSFYRQIGALRASGHVRRWHTIPTINHQTVAEHSGNAVALLILLHPNPTLDMIKIMLWHDSAERVVGDVPAPVRRRYPQYHDIYENLERKIIEDQYPILHEALEIISSDQMKWIKAIDVLELIMYSHEQLKLGNEHFGLICERGIEYLNNSDTPPEVTEYLRYYLTSFEEHH